MNPPEQRLKVIARGSRSAVEPLAQALAEAHLAGREIPLPEAVVRDARGELELARLGGRARHGTRRRASRVACSSGSSALSADPGALGGNPLFLEGISKVLIGGGDANLS